MTVKGKEKKMMRNDRDFKKNTERKVFESPSTVSA